MLNELERVSAQSPELKPIVKVLEALLDRVEGLEGGFSQLGSDIVARARVLAGRVKDLEERLDDVEFKFGE